MKKRVAIFEDDPVNRFTYQQLFSTRTDIELYIFAEPEKGIALARTIPFDIVFVEIHFWADFGGISILNKLKDVSVKPITFIATTALLQRGDPERILAAGFTLCIEKPVMFSQIDLCT